MQSMWGRLYAGPPLAGINPAPQAPTPLHVFMLMLALVGCRVSPGNEPVVFDGITMGTTYTVKVTPPLPMDRAELAAGAYHFQANGRVIEFVDTSVTTSHFARCPDSDRWRKKKG